MPLPVEDLRMRSPLYPEEAPFWPCLFFVHGSDDEILSVLFYDGSDAGGDHPVDEQGVVQWDETEEAAGFAVGWSLQVLASTEASALDPRRPAPSVNVLGDDLTVGQALEVARKMTAQRARVVGRTFEESKVDLLWRPLS